MTLPSEALTMRPPPGPEPRYPEVNHTVVRIPQDPYRFAPPDAPTVRPPR